MNDKKQQAGFTILGMLLSLVVLVMIGSAIWYVSSRSSDDSNNSKSTNRNNTSAADSTNTDSYQFPIEKLRVGTLGNWNITEKTSTQANDSCPALESLQLDNKENMAITIGMYIGSCGKGGTWECIEGVNDCALEAKTIGALQLGTKSVSLVAYREQADTAKDVWENYRVAVCDTTYNGLVKHSENASTQLAGIPLGCFTNKDGTTYSSLAAYPVQAMPAFTSSQTLDEFVARSDVQSAITVLKSLRY